MFVDALTEFSAAQAIANGTAVVSTSSVNLGAAARVGNEDDILIGVSCSAAAADTLLIEVIGSAAAALTTPTVLGSVTVVPAVGGYYVVKAVGLSKFQYLGLRYTTTGATPTATVSARVQVGRQAGYED